MRQLKQPIDYRVELMETAINPKVCYPQSGTLVHVLTVFRQYDLPNGGFDLVAVSPNDHHNYNRLMAPDGSTIIGVGRLVEAVGTEWMVAWRPFSPAPQLVALDDGEEKTP